MSSSRREDAARRARAGRPARAFLSLRRRLRSLTRRADRTLRRVEIGLWATGALLLTAAVGVRADAGLYQWRAERELGELARTAPAIAAPAPERQGPPRPALAEGTPLARLVVPRLDLEAVVAEGIGRAVLSRAVGRVPASARPGEHGNLALAAHRDTFFRPLERIRVGDRVRVERPDGVDEYQVEWTAVVEPSDVSVLADTPEATLTLVTCYPFDYVGPAPDRFVVRARRLDGGSVVADARRDVPRTAAGH
jgi:LPXTG-site transpeptidase (sortase) family protein